MSAESGSPIARPASASRGNHRSWNSGSQSSRRSHSRASVRAMLRISALACSSRRSRPCHCCGSLVVARRALHVQGGALAGLAHHRPGAVYLAVDLAVRSTPLGVLGVAGGEPGGDVAQQVADLVVDVVHRRDRRAGGVQRRPEDRIGQQPHPHADPGVEQAGDQQAVVGVPGGDDDQPRRRDRRRLRAHPGQGAEQQPDHDHRDHRGGARTDQLASQRGEEDGQHGRCHLLHPTGQRAVDRGVDDQQGGPGREERLRQPPRRCGGPEPTPAPLPLPSSSTGAGRSRRPSRAVSPSPPHHPLDTNRGRDARPHLFGRGGASRIALGPDFGASPSLSCIARATVEGRAFRTCSAFPPVRRRAVGNDAGCDLDAAQIAELPQLMAAPWEWKTTSSTSASGSSARCRSTASADVRRAGRAVLRGRRRPSLGPPGASPWWTPAEVSDTPSGRPACRAPLPALRFLDVSRRWASLEP